MKWSKKDIVSSIISLVFLSWFIVSLAGMSYCSYIQQDIMALAIGGQTFLGFGLFILFGAKNKIGILLIVIVAIVSSCVGINLFGSENLINLFNEKVIPLLASMVFIIFSIGCIIIPRYINYKRKKEKYTLITEATCKELKEDWQGGVRCYAPVWSYIVDGSEFTYCSNVYKNLGVTNIGEKSKIYLNPNDVNDIYIPIIPKEVQYLVLDVLGVSFAFFGGFIIYALFFGE